MYYPNNGFAIADTTARQLDTGWGAYPHVTAGDFSGDDHADVLAVNAAGDLMCYPNNGLTIADTTARRLDQDWGTFRHAM